MTDNAAEQSSNGTVSRRVADHQEGDGVVDRAAANGDAVAPAPAAPAPAANRWTMIKGFMFRMLIIYFVSSMFRSTPNPQQGKPADGRSNSPAVVSRGPGSNIFMKGSILDMYVYLSESSQLTDFGEQSATSSLFWLQKGLVYGDWTAGPEGDGTFIKEGVIPVNAHLENNGSLYVHIFIVKSGSSPNPRDEKRYSKRYTMQSTKMLTKLKSIKVSNTVNLLTGASDGPIVDNPNNLTKLPPSTHWHPNLTVQLLDDHSNWIDGSLPSPLNEFIKFNNETNEYYPVLYLNDYWNLQQDYMPINSTVKELSLRLEYAPISLFKWQLYAAQGMRNKWYASYLGDSVIQESDEEQDTLKKTLVETNPYLLGMTIVVSLVHSVFEFLAFKNDIQFWHTRESLEGLSVRSVFFNVFQSAIVVLYVFDNDTNVVVKISVFIGLLIEIWKIKKVINVTIDRENLIGGVIPRIRMQDKSTYSMTETKRFDQLAFRYLSWLLFPLLAIYAVYSLLYQEHKGWYSWVLNMLYGFLLTFGFIMMTPQLFINYKLKSVAHLPWRMLTYKALNTFIDDIFAFVIKMPTLYRLGCLRDDIIFFIYLYQRYIYPTDPSRLNEFGTSQDLIEKRKTEGVAPGSSDTLAIKSGDQPSEGEGASAVPTETTAQTENKKDK